MVGALTATLAVVVPAQVAQAAPCDVPIVNPVLCENTKTGSPESEWDVSGAGSANIQGFATDISVDNGQTVRFKVDTNATAYRLDIYRMGYYGGSGARRITTLSPSAALPQNQPNCLTQSTTGLVDCGNWAESASWATPADAVSGIYFAKLVRTDGTTGSSHIFFVVRDDQRNSEMLFQTSDTTWQAYNDYGGNSLYVGSPAGRAYKVSYNRPVTTRDNAPEDFVFNAEYPMVRWLERNGYDVSYTSGIDTDRFGSLLRNHKVFMSVGHDEYWSAGQRANVEAARDAGVNLAFFSGNEVFWKTRWEPSIASGSAAYRTLVSYKETHANDTIDPQDPPTWTGTWRDPRFSPPADGGRPENALTGQIFMANCCTNATIAVPGAYRTLRFWRNTRVASLAAGGSTNLTAGMLDYEWDSDLDNGSRPAGLLRMSSTTVNNQSVLQDYGSTYANGTALHNLTLYRASSGALVFGAGTVQWSWALDNNHDRGTAAADTAAQQATVNLFADMGVQPGSLQAGLVAAAQTTDSTAPTATITSPAAGANVALNTNTTISGTATDAGGGVVAGVEVSVDGGVSWHPATGTASWTYTWRPTTSGTYTIRVRAVDDSGRLQTPGAGVQVTAGSGGGGGGGGTPATCPCTIWPATTTPATLADPDTDAVELGVKFRASEDGTISGIRFYKASTNTGTHLGRLWTSAGTQLASVTFSGETASGWQQANFSTPVAITAGTTYVASYYAPVGRYSVNDGYFASSATTNGPLTALQDGTSGGNGVYRYGSGGGFPSSTFGSANYWVDVVFNPSADTVAPTVTARTPATGATDVPTTTTATATFSEPVQSSTVSMTMTGPGGSVAGQQAYDTAAQRVTFTPSAALTAGTTYTVNVSGAKDTAGNTMTAVSWSFTTVAPDTTAPTVTARTPATGATDVPLTTTATATFSEPVQSSTITMTLTGPGGAVAGAQSYDATAQRVTFTPSAALTAGTTYTVNVSGAKDTAGNTMTAVSWTFTTVPPDTAGPTVTARTPAAGATGVATSTTVTATFSEPVQSSTVALTVTGPGGQVGGQQTYDAATQRVTFTPSALLAPSTSYTVDLSGTKDLAGNTMTAVSWSFTTAAADTTAPTVTARTPAAGATAVSTGASVTATFSEPMQSTTINVSLTGPSGAVAGAQTYETAAQRVTFTPTLALASSTTYTVTVSGGKDIAGNTMANDSWTFTTVAAPSSGCPCSIWPATATPSTAANNDSASVEVGVKFRAASDGFITGIKFYKGTGNTGTHVGKLWSRTGTQLGSVTFTGETATGWQQATFASPIAVTAGTTYVASYYAPSGRYAINRNHFANAATVNGPLTALQNGTDGGNGVYRYGGGFPNSSFQSSNYWVDVVYTTSATDTTRPTVTVQSPSPGATSVPVTSSVSATFSESVQPTSITFQLTAPNSSVVPAQLAYDAATRVATLTPTSALSASTTYTAAISGASDAAGNVMAPVSWSFTTAATAGSLCPCSIWPSSATPAVASEPDSSAVNLGVKFRADRSGYVTGIRFFKGSDNTGTHVGHVWTIGGQSLGSVTFTGETASGWQQATFGAPIAVTAGTTYVASYHAPNGGYAVTDDYFNAATVNGPLTALADGTDGGNGVYGYGADGFPSTSFNSSNYWVDVVFDTTANDTTKPTITQRTPTAGASGVAVSTTVAATFSESVTPGSVAISVTGPGGAAVAGTSAWDAATLTRTFTPTSTLAYSTTYQVVVSGATDSAGNVMDPVTWSFTTAAEPPPPPDQGPGGPIAVVTSGGNLFTTYLAEILRTEGFNEFRTVALGNVTASSLTAYDVVVLGEMALTDAQATIFSDWVNSGGNLIAMRPDSRLSSLLGLTRATGTVPEGYVKVDTTTAAGAGITADTMQFHGTADRYTLSGASAIAALFTNASTASGNPAVTLRSVGSNGGQAAAFTYDLARSTVYLRQGNPAWAGQERDGDSNGVIRSDDLYFGGSATDWVNLSKVSIPQADEQQRLLANLIEVMNTDRKPLPRFWYLPRSGKAVVVATGDDHANGGTAGRFNTYAASSPSGCNVGDWACLRFTSYIYPGSPLSSSAATSYNNQGFEVALHPQNGCSNFTPSSLQATYSSDLSAWRSKYTGVPSPVSNRFHCLVYSDWASQPKTELANGIRFDVNYYYWPGSWIGDRPGFMTGSGIPMRFADTDGTMIDVYQSGTVMTDESDQSYPFTPNTLLDNALGAKGYYGAFTANMHTDQQSTFEDDQLVASATSRGVPIVTARQMLTWTDGRNGSSFGSIWWSNNTLSFNVAVGAGANGLTGMLPTAGPNGANLSTLTRGGSSVTFSRTTVKGVEYAMFAAAAGSYQAAYTVPQGAPVVTGLTTEPSTDGTAQLTFTTSQPATTELAIGTSPTDLQTVDTSGATTTQHTATVDELQPGTRYFFRVTSTDARGRSTTWPSAKDDPAVFRTPKADQKGPKVSRPDVLTLPDGTARVTWSTDEEADSRVKFGSKANRLKQLRLDSADVTDHAVMLTGLRPDRTYHYRIVTRDAAGNRTVFPARGQAPLSFVSSSPGVAVHTEAKLLTGRLSGTRVVDEAFGSLSLASGRTAGTYRSPVLDARAFVPWDRATWDADLPRGTRLVVEVRTGSTVTPGRGWSDWKRVSGPGGRLLVQDSRFLQYRVELVGSRGAAPTLTAIGFTHAGPPPAREGEHE